MSKNTLPKEFENKIRQYGKTIKKSKELYEDIQSLSEKYDFPLDQISGFGEYNEYLTYLSYGEGDIEENIDGIKNAYEDYKNNI